MKSLKIGMTDLTRNGLILSLALTLVACDSNNKNNPDESLTKPVAPEVHTDVLPFLNIQEQPAEYALPFCEKKNCIELDIQTVKTQDAWLNQWIAESQAKVIQDQIGLNQAMSLQQAINAYVKQSDAWQKEFMRNEAFELSLTTRIASQRNQYVLQQINVHTKQKGVTVKDRGYFFVADRKLRKKLSLLEIIEKDKQPLLNEIVQAKYQQWLKQQSTAAKKAAPAKLYWGQADWFFDDEGVGLHYRAHQIVDEGTQLDIYLTKAQTQQILQAAVFDKMF